MSDIVCKNCGTPIRDGGKFCPVCGSPALPQSEPSPDLNTAPKPQQPVQRPDPTPAPAYQNQPNRAFQNNTYTSYPNNTYANNPYANIPPVSAYNNTPLSVGGYIGMFLLLCLPGINFIMLLIWAFSSSVNKNKKNFARAILLLYVILIAVYILLIVLLLSSGALDNIKTAFDNFIKSLS